MCRRRHMPTTSLLRQARHLRLERFAAVTCPGHAHEAWLVSDGLGRQRQRLQLLGDGASCAHPLHCLLRLNQFAHHEVVGASQRTALAQGALSVVLGNPMLREAESVVEPRVLLVQLSDVQTCGAVAQVEMNGAKSRGESHTEWEQADQEACHDRGLQGST